MLFSRSCLCRQFATTISANGEQLLEICDAWQNAKQKKKSFFTSQEKGCQNIKGIPFNSYVSYEIDKLLTLITLLNTYEVSYAYIYI